MMPPRRFYDIPFKDFALALAAGMAVAFFGAVLFALCFHTDLLVLTAPYGAFTACMLMDSARCRLDAADRKRVRS